MHLPDFNGWCSLGDVPLKGGSGGFNFDGLCIIEDFADDDENAD